MRIRVCFEAPRPPCQDADIEILVDDEVVHRGRLLDGCNVVRRVAIGRHVLTARVQTTRVRRARRYYFNAGESVADDARIDVTVRLTYNKTWTNFAREFDVEPSPPAVS